MRSNGSGLRNQVVTELRVPHPSRFLRRVGTADLNEMCLLGSEVRGLKAVVPHISRKTSEIWGTLSFVAKPSLQKFEMR